jgi:hypothetical protein
MLPYCAHIPVVDRDRSSPIKMSSQAEQDNQLIADCDGAMQANHEFNRRCEEDWDDNSIRDLGDVRYSSLEKIMSVRATGLAALMPKLPSVVQ